MNHLFNIVTYTNKQEIAKKQNHQNVNLINESPFSPKMAKVLDNIGGFFIGSWAASFRLIIFGTVILYFFNMRDEHDFLMLFLKLFGFALIFYGMVDLFQVDDKTEMSFYDLGEKIHFSDEGIKIVSPQNTTKHAFLYKEIQQFTLCFKEIDIPYQTQIVIFLWHHQGQKYQYTIETPDETQVQNVMAFLHDIYTLKIPIREIDGNGKKMYMLNREYKPKKPEIAPEIQSLIDEIGEDDKT